MSEESQPGFRAVARDDLVSLQGPGLGVSFSRTEDRWTEAILGTGPAVEVEVARALVVPASDPARVACPVFQEWHLHGPAEGPSVCLLLTGLAFDHHFSAAVTLSSDPGGRSGVLLDLDVADRCRSRVEILAATYLIDVDSNALEAADPTRIAWSIAAPAPGRLELVAGPGASLAMAEAGRKATRVQVLAAIQPHTFTHRLRYGWRWTGAGG